MERDILRHSPLPHPLSQLLPLSYRYTPHDDGWPAGEDRTELPDLQKGNFICDLF